MPFVKNQSKNKIHFLYCSQVDIADETVKDQIEVFEALIASIDEVEGGNAVDIGDILLQPMQEGGGSLDINGWNSALVSTEL